MGGQVAGRGRWQGGAGGRAGDRGRAGARAGARAGTRAGQVATTAALDGTTRQARGGASNKQPSSQQPSCPIATPLTCTVSLPAKAAGTSVPVSATAGCRFISSMTLSAAPTAADSAEKTSPSACTHTQAMANTRTQCDTSKPWAAGVHPKPAPAFGTNSLGPSHPADGQGATPYHGRHAHTPQPAPAAHLEGRAEALLEEHEGDEAACAHSSLEHQAAAVVQHDGHHGSCQEGVGGHVGGVRDGLAAGGGSRAGE